MKKILSVILLTAIAAECIAGIQVYAVESNIVYVSQNGRENAKGSADDPVNSIKQAKDAAVRLKNSGAQSVEIRIKGGSYYFEDTLVLTQEDSGISYIGDGSVSFTQATKLNTDNFKKVTDPNVLTRLKSNVRPYILQYDLKSDNIDLSVNDSFYPYLYINDEAQTTARYPNGYYLVAENANDTNTFDTGMSRTINWKNNPDAIISGSLSTTYFWRNYKITSIAGNNVTLEGTIRKDAQYYADRILEELDVPGEYYVDRDNDILYYYPTGTINDARITTNGCTMIKSENADNVLIKGITFEKSGGMSVEVTNGTNFNIEECDFYDIQGEYVLKITGQDCTVSKNYAYNCDNAFIKYEGGDLDTLSPGNVIIENNRISNCGNFGRGSIIKSGNSIFGMLTSCGNIVRNNIIQDCMVFTPIVFGGNNYTISKNELFNVGRLINDGGAIYFGRSNVQYGNKVIGNYIHDLNMDLSYCGIYSDDGYCGAYVKNNVIARADQAMIINIGMNDRFIDNLFIDTDSGITGGSMMGRDTGSSLFTETYTTLFNASYKDAFRKAYPDMVASLSRSPFFASYDTYITGNVMIGQKENDITLKTRHWHFYNEDIDTDYDILNEKGAITENYGSYIGSTYYVGTKVDDLTGYGPSVKDSNGSELNGTPEGNPYYQYNSDLFSDDGNQDYTLTQSIGPEGSEINNIDMSDVGIVSGTLPGESGKEVFGIYPKDNAQNIDPQNIPFTWSTVKNASVYEIKVSQNSDMSNPVIDEVFYETYADSYLIRSLDYGKKYYWTVTAKGIGKQDSFTITSSVSSFETCASDHIDTTSLAYAVEVVDKEYEEIENGEIKYEQNALDAINDVYESAVTVLSNPQTTEEVDQIENEIYDILILAQEYKTNLYKPEISECRVSDTDKAITVYAKHFPKNSLVSILVTNPEYSLDNAYADSDLISIQYASIEECDSEGNITFTFDTIVRGSDMPGEYRVYISDESGVIYSASYIYAHIQVGAIKYYDENLNEIGSIKDAGRVIMECTINNRTNKELDPVIVTSYYNKNKLCKAEVSEAGNIPANSAVTLRWETDSIAADADEAKVFFMDSFVTMKPYTTARVIYEKE